MTAKEQLHNLVEELSEEEAATTLIVVERGREDPMLQALASAPIDDEPETDEEREAVAEARADRDRGLKPVPLDEVLAEFDGQ
jgi:hypothetical protein